MNSNSTPEWLKDIQNKSWEPEIIISGITLTSLFIISNYIYNFYGMLVQDFAVFDAISLISYNATICILTALKLVLVLHLIMRGIWTGMVGISYVFPEGVKKENLREREKNIGCERPEVFVIRLEKICSLLFSFIFTSVIFVLGFFLLNFVIIVLFLTGLDIKLVNNIMLYILIPSVYVFSILYAIFSKKIQKTEFAQRLSKLSPGQNILIFVTNIGRLKTFVMFGIFFLIILGISWSGFDDFSFRNRDNVWYFQKADVTKLNSDHYRDIRIEKRRINKTAVNSFNIESKTLELFIAAYKEDHFTLKQINKDPDLKKMFRLTDSNPGIIDLYNITIDGKALPGHRWYSIEYPETGQKGFLASIEISSLDPGPHVIRINKIFCKIRTLEMKWVYDWDVVPFEVE